MYSLTLEKSKYSPRKRIMAITTGAPNHHQMPATNA